MNLLLSWTTYALAILMVILYYAVKKETAWWILLLGSFLLYVYSASRKLNVILFLLTIVLSWGLGGFLKKKPSRTLLAGSVLLSSAPLLLVRFANVLPFGVIVPLGLSFYTLSMIAYLVDIYQGKLEPEGNFFKYALFMMWFPKILQGPIMRYQDWQPQIEDRKPFDEQLFWRGVLMIVWGFFLKLVIADKASVIVATIFGGSRVYQGWYVVVGAMLYGVELYADFLACVQIAKGLSYLFGLSIPDNFNHPYISQSVAEFWRRWHLTLSSWLRDYIYFPLGGNRKGKLRQYMNIMIVFLVSGFWHGTGLQFIFWGFMQGAYQMIGRITLPYRDQIAEKIGLRDRPLQVFRTIGTYIWITLAWIVFRADSFRTAARMYLGLLKLNNFWIFFDGSLSRLGLVTPQVVVLLVAIAIWIGLGRYEVKHGSLSKKIATRSLLYKGIVLFVLIAVIWVFGTYGVGYNAADFIYGGF